MPPKIVVKFTSEATRDLVSTAQAADPCSSVAGSDLETALVGLCDLSIKTSVIAVRISREGQGSDRKQKKDEACLPQHFEAP